MNKAAMCWLAVQVLVGLASGATFTVSPTNLDFCVEAGGSTSAPLAIGSSQAGGASAFQATQSWVKVPASAPIDSVVTVTVDASALTPKTYTDTITVINSDGSTHPVPITAQVFPTGSSPVCPTTVLQDFYVQRGSAQASSPQLLNVGGSGKFTVTIEPVSGVNWLLASQTDGPAPGLTLLGVNTPVAAGLADGLYQTKINLKSGGGTFTFNATLHVTDGPVVVQFPATLLLNVAPSANPATRNTEIESTPSVAVTVLKDQSSACLAGSSPQTGTTPLAEIVAPRILSAPGNCDSGLFINATSSSYFDPAIVNVSDNPINFAPGWFQIQEQQGSNPPNQTASITGATTEIQLTTITTDPTNWISATLGSGTTFSLNYQTSQEAVGTHYGAIIAWNNGNPVASVPLTLTITQKVTVTLSPEPITFNVVPGGTAQKTFHLDSDPPALHFTVKASTQKSEDQATVDNAAISTPADIAVSVIAGTKIQTDFLQLTFSMPGTVYAFSGPIEVTNLQASIPSLSFKYTQGDPLPSPQEVKLSAADGAQVPFTVNTASGTTSAGNFLTITPTSGTLPATLSVGLNSTVLSTVGSSSEEYDASFNKHILTPGTYTATVKIDTTTEGSFLLGATLIVNAGTMPTIDAVADAASFFAGKIIRGGIYTAFGHDLTSSTGINLAPSLPLPQDILNDSVAVDGAPVPLVAVDNVNGAEQINFIAPWNLMGPTAQIAAVRNGVMGPAITVQVVDDQPGIYTYADGGVTYAAALHANFSSVNTSNPAVANETLLFFVNACGAVNSPPADGAAANGQTTVKTPTLKIGGKSASVTFTGLAPGFASLCQVNGVVPAGLTGNQLVTVQYGDGVSNSAMLPIKH